MVKVRIKEPGAHSLRLPGEPFGYTPRADEYFEQDAPLVKAHPWAFATDEELASVEPARIVESVRIEQATAAPGERRNARRT